MGTAELPTGTVTMLFTDIEGSTRLLEELGDAYADALGEHRRLLRAAFDRHGGVEVDTQGDAFFVVFPTASGALAAATEAQAAQALRRELSGAELGSIAAEMRATRLDTAISTAFDDPA